MLGIFLDTETSGLNPLRHAVLQVAYKILNIETGQCLHAYEATLHHPKEVWDRSNPESLKVTGFTWDQNCKGEDPHLVAEKIIADFSQFNIGRKNAVFICQNPSFDRAFFSQLIDPDLQESLGWPYHWLDLASMFWALNIQKGNAPWETGVSKDRIASFYRLPPENKPHRAMNGVEHLLQCYEAVVGFPLMQIK